MFRNIVFSAFGAGVVVCLAVTTLQGFTTQPLIVTAEAYEDRGPAHGDGFGAPAAAQGEDQDHWSPDTGLERTLLTALANFVFGTAISLMLLGCMVLSGRPVNAELGLLWGVGGFVAVSLLPALGLPPDLPGTPAGEHIDRQIWWIGTAAASSLGIMAIAFRPGLPLTVVGIALLVAPHIIGAPAPPSLEVPYPGALAGEFAIASLIVSAVLWCLSGGAGGWLHARFSAAADHGHRS
jgi:cobalt transporter subunit CbtA